MTGDKWQKQLKQGECGLFGTCARLFEDLFLLDVEKEAVFARIDEEKNQIVFSEKSGGGFHPGFLLTEAEFYTKKQAEAVACMMKTFLLTTEKIEDIDAFQANNLDGFLPLPNGNGKTPVFHLAFFPAERIYNGDDAKTILDALSQYKDNLLIQDWGEKGEKQLSYMGDEALRYEVFYTEKETKERIEELEMLLDFHGLGSEGQDIKPRFEVRESAPGKFMFNMSQECLDILRKKEGFIDKGRIATMN